MAEIPLYDKCTFYFHPSFIQTGDGSNACVSLCLFSCSSASFKIRQALNRSWRDSCHSCSRTKNLDTWNRVAQCNSGSPSSGLESTDVSTSAASHASWVRPVSEFYSSQLRQSIELYLNVTDSAPPLTGLLLTTDS